jgi:hypothetical protein
MVLLKHFNEDCECAPKVIVRVIEHKNNSSEKVWSDSVVPEG